jgi:hypothetical protein
MNGYRNNPELKDENSKEGMVKRYVHQPLTFDHFGIRATIKENGHVLIASAGNDSGEYDEVEVPASLIFKLATSLKLTRTVKYVSVNEAARLPKVSRDD